MGTQMMRSRKRRPGWDLRDPDQRAGRGRPLPTACGPTNGWLWWSSVRCLKGIDLLVRHDHRRPSEAAHIFSACLPLRGWHLRQAWEPLLRDEELAETDSVATSAACQASPSARLKKKTHLTPEVARLQRAGSSGNTFSQRVVTADPSRRLTSDGHDALRRSEVTSREQERKEAGA